MKHRYHFSDENSVVASTEAPHRAVRVAPVFWGATVSG